MPDALLNDFIFWQNADNSITGYQRPDVRDRTQTAFALRVYITAEGTAAGFARIVRKNLNDVKATNDLSKQDLLAPTRMDKILWEEEIKGSQSGKAEEYTLLNLAYATEGTFLSELAEYLIRLEDMSCIYQLAHMLVCRYVRFVHPTNL